MINECPTMYRILMKLIGGGGICNCCVVYPENSCTDLRYSTKIPNKVFGLAHYALILSRNLL